MISLWLPGDAAALQEFLLKFSLLRRTTYTRTGGFCFRKLLGFSSGRTQNPPVLWLTERACSCPEQPLSATHGRQRYNTLDLASKIVCHETAGFIGFFLPRRALPSIGCLLPRQRCRLWKPLPTGHSRPYWKPRAKGKSHPFGIPARFEMRTHKLKMVCRHSFQNAKIPRTSADKKMMFRGYFVLKYHRPLSKESISQPFCASGLQPLRLFAL